MQRGLSQAKLARLTGIPRTNLSRIEHGLHTPSLKRLQMYAAAYETTIWKIVKFAEEADEAKRGI
jgi:transcriptional regulator with XRE-family HTH domain